jgi:hypothetical protein
MARGWSKWLLVAFFGIGMLVLLQQCANLAHPARACDDPSALHALANLYDNRRLLRATAVAAPRLQHDGVQGRFCLASVTFADGSRREVSYGYSAPSRHGGRSFWIDYNR